MGNCLGQCLAGKNGLRQSRDEDDEELVPDEEDADQNLIFRIMKFKRKKPSPFLNTFWKHQDQTYSRLNSDHPPESATDIHLQCLDAQSLMLSAREVPPYSKSSFQHDLGIASSSRASSSLDLEWEHEYAANNNTNIQLSQSWLFVAEEDPRQYQDSDQASNSSLNNLTNNGIQTDIKQKHSVQSVVPENSNRSFLRQSSKANNWSHISTPESLEWDIDEEQQQRMVIEDDNLDHETLELLHEIELLKNKVLEETGDGLGFEVIIKQVES